MIGVEDAVENSPQKDETKQLGADQTIECAQCGVQFVFSVDEQAYFEKRGLHAPPKRCKECRALRKKSRRGAGSWKMADYRGPAFKERRDVSKIYRSPAFQGKKSLENIYRSPAFQGKDAAVEDIYRGPAFQNQEDTREIYRSPAFQKQVFEIEESEAQPVPEVAEGEHDLELGPPPNYREPMSPHEIYRSPAFADTDPANYAPSYRRREMHEIICNGCGKKSRVPFKPQKDRPVFCKDCYAKNK